MHSGIVPASLLKIAFSFRLLLFNFVDLFYLRVHPTCTYNLYAYQYRQRIVGSLLVMHVFLLFHGPVLERGLSRKSRIHTHHADGAQTRHADSPAGS